MCFQTNISFRVKNIRGRRQLELPVLTYQLFFSENLVWTRTCQAELTQGENMPLSIKVGQSQNIIFMELQWQWRSRAGAEVKQNPPHPHTHTHILMLHSINPPHWNCEWCHHQQMHYYLFISYLILRLCLHLWSGNKWGIVTLSLDCVRSSPPYFEVSRANHRAPGRSWRANCRNRCLVPVSVFARIY